MEQPLQNVLAAAEQYAIVLENYNHPDAKKLREDIETVRRESRPLGSMNDVQGR